MHVTYLHICILNCCACFPICSDDHRFPMPKDHLLYLALQAEGLAQLTFTPTYPGKCSSTFRSSRSVV